ncbi:pirin family protein [Falsiroseomonas selenitidurans]|uniref:Pirin family protein n=1 Tax=Falsiroseomonas selenitidurans TaxID=2716335 RepID=A0ABX1E2V8_9PROT|nr:pirin family protein [Falsiroseomonas selenitidurans]NKC31499.1 pirin family protein [Falsiroseomonas selenitidurans]
MSIATDPTDPLPPGLETVILPRTHDIGGFEVRRALPAKERQMVGPFIFFDQMGPGEFLTGKGVDVRPHPHIGLSTVTYLFEGEILHRDSLGTELPIAPGDVNWMTAGQGIVHSERTAAPRRVAPHRLSGIQSWVALPKAHEETAPAFVHHGSASLPTLDAEGVKLRLVAGAGWGLSSPVATLSELFYADAVLAPGAQVPMPDLQEERGAYVFAGSVEVAGQVFEAGRMLVFRAGDRMALKAGAQGARLLLLGGAAMDGPRYLFWNFVSSSRDRIEQAKVDWARDRFGTPVPGETEWIPLPEKKVVRAGEGAPTS